MQSANERFDRVATVVKPGDIWSSDLEYPDYFFSTDGRIASVIRRRARILKPIRAGEGYQAVSLRDRAGVLRREYVHHLIARFFIGPRPDGMHIRHLNGDKTDNDIGNLAYGTPAENAADKQAHGTSPNGERNGMARLTSAEVEQMRQRRAETGASYRSIALDFGVSVMTAYRAITGQAWSLK